MAKKLLPHLPLHKKMFVEPFFGAGGIFFAKPKVKQEFINDLNGDVTNFFEVLRDYPEWLRRLCSITPYSRDEYYNCRDNPWPSKDTLQGKMECARRFWVLARQGMGAPLRNSEDSDTSAAGWKTGERGEGQSGKSHDANNEVKMDEIGGFRTGGFWVTPEYENAKSRAYRDTNETRMNNYWMTPEYKDREQTRSHADVNDVTKPSGWRVPERVASENHQHHTAANEAKAGGWRVADANEDGVAKTNHQAQVNEVKAPGWRPPERQARETAQPHVMTNETRAGGWMLGIVGEGTRSPNTEATNALVQTDATWHWLESWCEENYEAGHNPTRFDKLAERLAGVAIDNRPATTIIKRYNREHCFLYLDPPYVMSTRNAYLYKYEMSDEEHIELLDAAKEHKGLVAISGYNSELYDKHLEGWRKVEFNVTSGLARGKTDGKKGKRIEVLWMNYSPLFQRLDSDEKLTDEKQNEPQNRLL